MMVDLWFGLLWEVNTYLVQVHVYFLRRRQFSYVSMKTSLSQQKWVCCQQEISSHIKNPRHQHSRVPLDCRMKARRLKDVTRFRVEAKLTVNSSVY
jgi:hypothetical protein